MNNPFIMDKTYKGVDYTINKLAKGEYENCVFDSCAFTEADLSNVSFMECTFLECDLSNVNLTNTAIKECEFKNCKMLGVRFDHCNPFLLSFKFLGCSLNLSSFYNLALKNTVFEDCSLHQADFSQSDLSNAMFENCDLKGAIFESSVLIKTNFRTAVNISIDPENNKLKKAKFSKEGALGLLLKYDIDID
ncbi:pentapeptide repeat-containing protein [Arenibacter latericius]|uniref:pentapeptide repeat-containing protein n=1 Tax=Arenibacter latericius TaxID=86104 RepID=UPI0004143892|nr:pentapeptide repeat-containing protein [Arenibacter latericius]